MTGIEKAIQRAGSMAAIADDLGVRPQSVFKWRDRGYVPVDRVVEMEARYGIDRKELIDPKLADLLERPFEGE